MPNKLLGMLTSHLRLKKYAEALSWPLSPKHTMAQVQASDTGKGFPQNPVMGMKQGSR